MKLTVIRVNGYVEHISTFPLSEQFQQLVNKANENPLSTDKYSVDEEWTSKDYVNTNDIADFAGVQHYKTPRS